MTTKDYSACTLWGIHGGRIGDADDIFLKKNQVALGWEEMGDLAPLPPTRDSFKEKLLQALPNHKPGYYPIAAGQLFRFVHEMQQGNLVVYPSKCDKQIHIGEITGPYHYVSRASKGFPHRRAVKWLKACPRTSFTQGALYELGSAMALFMLKNYADEYTAALTGQGTSLPTTEDDTVSYVAADIEQNTRDYVLKTLAQELKGHGLAGFAAHLLETMGYNARVSPPGPDGGVDIIAHKDELGFVPPIIKVQVKSSEGSVGSPIVSQLVGNLAASECGMLITLGTFTSQARSTARNKSTLRLIDGDDLVDLVLQHYQDFDSKYKGMMPLKRVYVPEPLDESES